MNELVVLMTLLARAWMVLCSMQRNCVALPPALMADAEKLREDLTRLFNDPLGMDRKETVAEVETPAPKHKLIECQFCSGSGALKGRFIGEPDRPCQACKGVGAFTEEEI